MRRLKLMKTNKKLTLKALKQELDKIKADKKSKSTIDPNIKNSYINNLHMRLRENSMLSLYIISGILAYAHKIPILGRIITLLSLYYGRTTIWQILVQIRKAFIIFNAIIGLYMVFNTVGFSFDNILAGFTGLGQTYIELLINFTKKLFNWFVELFDHKVVPNVPSEPKNPKSFIPKITNWNQTTPIDKNVFNPFLSDNSIANKFSLRELYTKNPITIEITPWYKDLSTWLWISGVICTIGLAYGGYKFLTDPTFIETIFSADSTPKSNPSINVSSSGDINSPDITLTGRITKGLGVISSGIGKTYSYTIKKLNPINWITSSSDIKSQFQNFMNKQK